MEEIIYLEIPSLHEPCLILGFDGWPNAAEISSYGVLHLIEKFEAKRFAFIPIENFYQYSASRPVAHIREGKIQDLKFPGYHFYYSKCSPPHDLIFFHGAEPHFRWSAFANLIVNLAERFGVSKIFTLGGTYDYIPHTAPPVVSAVFNHDELKKELVREGVGLTEYNGPISIHTFILEAAKKREMKAISLWGHAPHYLQTRNVKATCSVLKRLLHLMGIEADLSDLEMAGDYFEQQISQLVERDPKLREMISKLEEAYRKAESSELSRRNGKKEEKVIYMQAFLKRPEDEEKNED